MPPPRKTCGGGFLLKQGKPAGGGLWLCTHLPFSICYNVQGGRRVFSAAPGRQPLLWPGPLRADGTAVRRRYQF